MSLFFATPSFLRGALVGAVCLTGYLMLSGGQDGLDMAETTTLQPAPIQVAQRDLRFEDRPDGAVAVFEAGTGEPLQVLSSSTDSFIRIVVRGLVRERASHRISDQEPFRLARWSNGAVTLEDLATGRQITLDAFGHTNAGAFARFLPARMGATP